MIAIEKSEEVRTEFNLPVKEKLKRPSAYREVAARTMLLRNGFRFPDIFNSPLETAYSHKLSGLEPE